MGSGSDAVNLLIFSVYDRSEVKRYFEKPDYEPKAIAANSFRTNAEVHLYSKHYDGFAYSGSPFEDTNPYVFVDPQAEIPVDSLFFVKEVENGVTKLYVIACSAPSCSADKTSVGELVHPSTGGVEGGFRC